MRVRRCRLVLVCGIALCSLAATVAWSTPPAVADPQQHACDRLLAIAQADPNLELVQVEDERTQSAFVRGTYSVFENRERGEGRRISIALIVLPARSDEPAPDPVFILHGGPGAAASAYLGAEINGWLRERHDVVLIDQRGTGGSNRLDVPLPSGEDDLQKYFDPLFQREPFLAALPELQRRADLSQYTTNNSVDDFEEIRQALHYDTINLRGGSYGSRCALVYMRRHPESIRTATLNGVQPIAYRNPLPHARSAQEALDLIFAEIRASERYRRAFPDIEAKFQETLHRLETTPAKVIVKHPSSGENAEITLDRDAFAESVRVLMYSLQSNRRLPRMLMLAYEGNYRELAEASLNTTRGLRGLIALGMLMCVTGSEDIPRIDPGEIEAACARTFLGARRVRNQLEVAAIWPSGALAANFGQPVHVNVPVLLLSGTHDPTTTPQWGEQAASHLPNSLHVIVPGGHGVGGPAVTRLERAFLEAGSVEGLDLTEVRKLPLPPLVLPDGFEDQ